MRNYILSVILGLFFGLTIYAQDFKYKKTHYHLLNSKGKVVKNIYPFTFAESFSEDLALVEKDLKFGFINTEGQQVINFKFYDAGSFSNGLAYASVGENYGYINKNGEFVIAPSFEIARDFEGEFAQVLKLNPDTLKYGSLKWLYGFINKQGKLIADSYFSSMSYCKVEDCFIVSIRDSVFYLSTDGSLVQKENIPNQPFYIVDEMPQYKRGVLGLRQFIETNVRYPISAQIYGLMGRVYVEFVIDEKGKVDDVQFINKESPVLMKEAVRVIKEMPQWKPGLLDGKAVKVRYALPINFVLQ
jgi:TonB family protein